MRKFILFFSVLATKIDIGNLTQRQLIQLKLDIERKLRHKSRQERLQALVGEVKDAATADELDALQRELAHAANEKYPKASV